MMHKPLLIGLLLAFTGGPAYGKDVPAVRFDERAVDALLLRALAEFHAPGMAVAVVENDRVIYLAGLGYRSMDGREPVTPDTLFAIGSCTKAFTATAAGMLAEEGKMNWDDPVRKHLPGFRLSDATADGEVTLRDLLCHRTGLLRHDLIRYRAPWDQDEMVRRIGLLKLSHRFRSTYDYCNLGFLAAGMAVARADGRPFAECLQRRLFEPLGMRSVVCSAAEVEKTPDHAAPHLRRGHRTEVVERYLQETDGAGGLNASARDLTRWLRVQLAGGVLDGKQVVPARVLKETHTQQIDVKRSLSTRLTYPEGITTKAGYGLGWGVADYRGEPMIAHSGAIDGFRSRTVLLPRRKAGFVILCNLGRTSLPEAAANALLDHLLGHDGTDWYREARDIESKQKETRLREEETLKAYRKPDTKPSLPLWAYAGDYEEPAYGAAKVALDGGTLRLNWGRLSLPLDHFAADTFRLADVPPYLTLRPSETLVVFRLSAGGGAETMRFLGQEFRRAARR